jgi:hypothetical protein
MGAEQGYDDMEVTLRDSDVFNYIVEVLQNVRMVRTFHP